MNHYLFQLSLPEAEQFLTDCFARALARVLASSEGRPPVDKPGALLQMKDVCALLSISRPTCYEWMRAGRLPFYRKGRRLYFKHNEVLASLEKPKARFA
ncbi:helix-turn-helix domain-containing protein [Hymenobacter edaphi]|uniref:Helix-turn-helix domain-containing protein n=1 Tax=Hymenobacter edaphi TaxID=2211146 RepID=A0A328B9E1_9BACT|nr:helix-turn-helix domain-containing protein [Hymenobacter edaphi]RAK63439.1 hypothetical protein DLM85_20750 [Hymenobacter edaphi]